MVKQLDAKTLLPRSRQVLLFSALYRAYLAERTLGTIAFNFQVSNKFKNIIMLTGENT